MNVQTDNRQNERIIARWLLIGVGMIMIQVWLGGVTRLTGSGLSITEWQPILGALPPMNQTDWEAAFEKYKEIGQYKHINFDFTLSDFKFIYFWEWLHRNWGRLIGLVFFFPFLYFLRKKMIRKDMVLPLIALFLLGGLQAVLGWIMVMSGLNQEDVSVDHIRLAIHFMAAMLLLSYTFWFALRFLIPSSCRIRQVRLQNFTLLLLGLLLLQLTYGAFMAGLKAGSYAPTWPTINGAWIPEGMTQPASEAFSLTDNPFWVQFIHRGLGYLIAVLTLVWHFRARQVTAPGAFEKYRPWPLLLVILQVLLGIFTVSFADNAQALLWLGVSHQFVAMFLLLSLLLMVYLLKPARQPSAA